MVGQSVPRREAPNKVTGRAKYTADIVNPGELVAAVAVSDRAHARLRRVDPSAASAVPGVVAVVTGEDVGPLRAGEVLEDRPPIARTKVRYWGEPIAVVVAYDEWTARHAAQHIRVEYDDLPAVTGIDEALAPGAPLVHEDLGRYRIAQPPVHPRPGTNIADHAHLEKGQATEAMAESAVVVTATYTLPQVDHAAMETRAAKAEILHDGRVIIHATTQAPFEVQKLLATYFDLSPGQVIVNAPLVGGAFGGKAAVQLEILAYLASRAAGGRLVRLVNPREHDLAMSPVGMGLKAMVRMGATRSGRLTAAALTYFIDTGAYTDSSPRVARALLSQCTGPYAVPHVTADVYVVYTNHPYTTAFRGFGHMPLTFAVERTMDKLAVQLGMDALELRRRNAVAPGDTSPTRVPLTRSNLGDVAACLERAGRLIGWETGPRMVVGPETVRAKGLAAFWKTSSSPPNATSGAILTMNQDGSINLSTGTVEFGPGTKTTAAQILAAALNMDIRDIHVHTHINTKVDPEHWKTVASLSTYMVGRAVLAAADDLVRQLKAVAAQVLRCDPRDLAVANKKVYLKDDPATFVPFGEIAHGYQFAGGRDGIGGQIIGRGSDVLRHLSVLDDATGAGRPGRAWTVGAAAVDVEVGIRDGRYRVLTAAVVIDAGRVLNPQGALGVVIGGMCQGIGLATREALRHTADGRLLTDTLRTYKVMRPGEQPERYLVDFVETPQDDAPYGARALGEHGVLGIPAALANALARAAEVEVDSLPATPEVLWRLRGEAARG